MGAALFIVLEREVSGVDAGSVGGKSLSRNLDWLDDASKKLNVLSLGEMISVNPEDAAAFLEGEGQNASGLSLPAEQWFDAAEGLRTVKALLQHTKSLKPGEKLLLQDLTACQQVLDRARQECVRFHFTVDF
jgi:hypothetical protein